MFARKSDGTWRCCSESYYTGLAAIKQRSVLATRRPPRRRDARRALRWHTPMSLSGRRSSSIRRRLVRHPPEEARRHLRAGQNVVGADALHAFDLSSCPPKGILPDAPPTRLAFCTPTWRPHFVLRSPLSRSDAVGGGGRGAGPGRATEPSSRRHARLGCSESVAQRIRPPRRAAIPRRPPLCAGGGRAMCTGAARAPHNAAQHWQAPQLLGPLAATGRPRWRAACGPDIAT